MLKYGNNLDVLIHEVYPESEAKPEQREGGDDWPQYLKEFHTSDVELGRLAAKMHPGLLVLYHIVGRNVSSEVLIGGIRKGGYKGEVVVGKDLDTY